MGRRPPGDVFSEMQGCVEQGISGRPSLARFVEITYEAILLLKRQVDELRARRRSRAKHKHATRHAKKAPKSAET